MLLFSQRKQVSLHRRSRSKLSTCPNQKDQPTQCLWHSGEVIEQQTLAYSAPAGHGRWLALADALDAAVVTLRMGVPDPLWFGPSRYAFDHTAELVIDELRQARWAALAAESGQS